MFCVNVETLGIEKKSGLKEFLERRGCSVLHQNVRGLLTNFTAVEELISSNPKIDILTLSETHICTSENNDNLYKISGYNFEKRNRVCGKGGGVAAYVKNTINYVRRADLESRKLENIVIEIILKNSNNFLITTHYRPPQSSNYLQSNYHELFSESLALLSDESKEVILLGDLNVNFLKPTENREIKSILHENGFTQLIKEATRVTKDSKTLIDIIATNKPATIAASTVIPCSISDHDLIACVRKLNHQKFSAKTVKCRNYASYDPEIMNHDFERVNWFPVLTAPDVNIALNIFNGIVKDIFDKHAPIINKRVKGRPCPWIDNELKQNMDRRDKVLRKARKSNTESDWKTYKTLRNLCNNMQRKAKGAYRKNMIEENRLNPKSFWKAVKDVFPTKAARKSNTNSQSNNRKLTKNFRDYFSTVVHKLKSSALKLKEFVWQRPEKVILRTNKSFKFRYISMVFIQNFLKNLQRNKATGLDELPPGMLKDCRNHIATPIHFIVNLSLQSSTVPTAWKQAKLTPIFKSGDHKNVENYRPISVLPILSKLVEKAVHTQLLEFLETNNLLNDAQFGYRAKRSTQLASTLLVDEIRDAADTGNMVGALFLDLTKAFDTISHSVILSKLRNYGISSIEIEWFADYLFNRTQHVEVGNQLSSPFNVFSGVPQGSILGPLLFLIFFDDFPEQLSKASCIQYADDTVVYVTHNNVTTIESILNHELENLDNYCYKNELILNLKKGKTETMLFGTAKQLAKQTKSTITVFIQGQPVNHETSYTYLGNKLDSKLTLNDNFEIAYKKTSGRLNLLYKLRSFLSVDAAHKIYEMVIVPILMYSTLISLQLTTTQQKKLKSLDNRAKRIVGGDVKIVGIEARMKMKACITVKKCLNDDTCDNFKTYFELHNHSIRTRNNKKLVKLPKVKLEFGKKAFKFQGAKAYNDLPLSIRESDNFTDYRGKLVAYFSK